VTAPRSGRGQRPAGAAPAPDLYTMVVGGMVACVRCAALLLDTRPARSQHDKFHAALKQLWEQTGGRS
jgi:hypothetical protein